MVAETKKMLDPKIKLTATAVRVPVFIGHSEAVNIEFENPITPEERAICAKRGMQGVIDKHENGGYITPYESAGEDATFISRIREDITVENGLASNGSYPTILRKGRCPECNPDCRASGGARSHQAEGAA